jgi:26S proteasome regulatory subunit N2
MGAILAQGILDAGGRNVVISLQSHMGFTKMASVVGLALWLQHWFWYPLFHFLELSFQTTLAVGLNKDLKLPKNFALICHSKKSIFATPKRMEEKKEEKKELVATAVLSTTAKAKARQAKHEKEKKEPSKEAETGEKNKTEQEKSEKESEATAMEIDAEGTSSSTGTGPTKKNTQVKEPLSFTLSNPSRVTLTQEQFVVYDLTQRYVPIVPTRRPAGVIILKDTKPEEAEEVEDIKTPAVAGTENEAEPPEPFEWSPPQ